MNCVFVTRKQGSHSALIHHTGRLADVQVRASMLSRSDSDDKALAETINGVNKAELIRRRAPWKSRQSVELVTSMGTFAAANKSAWPRLMLEIPIMGTA